METRARTFSSVGTGGRLYFCVCTEKPKPNQSNLWCGGPGKKAHVERLSSLLALFKPHHEEYAHIRAALQHAQATHATRFGDSAYHESRTSWSER